jgi:hypothetical protein
VCGGCVEDVAQSGAGRDRDHPKFNRFLKFLMMQKELARVKVCALPSCKRTVEGDGTRGALVSCAEHATKFLEALFWVSGGEFEDWHEEGSLDCKLAAVARASGPAPSNGGGDKASDSPGGAANAGPPPAGQGAKHLVCGACKVTDATVGGFEMTFVDGVPGPRDGEFVLCVGCRGKLAAYMKGNPTLLKTFQTKRGWGMGNSGKSCRGWPRRLSWASQAR